MASFVIHHIVGEYFLKELEQKYGIILTEEQKNHFLLGNLIADSTKLEKQMPDNLTEEEQKHWKRNFQKLLQEEKLTTHFRNKNDSNLCIQIPNLDTFLEKYQSLLAQDFSVLGYFFHLYTDKLFFCDLFRATFDTLDENFNHTDYINKLKFILIKNNNKIEKQEEVWAHDSNVSIYQDYTVMNHLLLEYYKISFHTEQLLESITSFHNPGIKEVDYKNIVSIIKKTKCYIEESYHTEGYLHVFSEEQVKNFIPFITDTFITNYYPLFKALVTSLKEKQKIYTA